MICSGCIVGSYHNESFVIFSVALQAQLTDVPHCEGRMPSSSLNNARRDISLYAIQLLEYQMGWAGGYKLTPAAAAAAASL